jgi:hypothetical protein
LKIKSLSEFSKVKQNRKLKVRIKKDKHSNLKSPTTTAIYAGKITSETKPKKPKTDKAPKTTKLESQTTINQDKEEKDRKGRSKTRSSAKEPDR